MSEAFVSIKRKYLKNALIISGAVGLSVGLLAVGVLMLIFKLTLTEFNPLWYVLIGVGGALLVGGILFLILRPTNKRLAKHLDEKFALNEKVQTMVEFEGKDGDMVKLQRMDADSRLKNVPAKSFNLKRWWAYLVAVVVAAGSFCTAFFIPEKEPENEEPPEVEFDATEWQISRLKQLINDVKKSKNFYDEVKTGIVMELEGLLETMQLDYVTESQITEQVLQAITDIYTVVDENISYNDIGEKMKSSSSNENVKKLANAILTLNVNNVTNRLVVIRESFRGYYEEETEPEGGEEEQEETQPLLEGDAELEGGETDGGQEEEPDRIFVDYFGLELYEVIIEFTSAGKISMDVPGIETDGLYIKLNAFYDGLSQLAGDINNLPTENAQARLDAYFNESTKAFYDVKIEIENQANNRYERDNVVNRLMEIFNLTDADLPEEVLNQRAKEKGYEDIVLEDSKDDEVIGSGGAGSDETKFGSNDLIYNPYDDEHVEYGKVILDWYYDELGRMEAAGVPQEIIDLYKKYFDEYLTGNSSSNNDAN